MPESKSTGMPSAEKPSVNRLGKEEVYDALHNSDAELARVTEDLISLLVRKNTILFTELPEIVQVKLLAREKLRDELGSNVISPLSDDETI